MVAKKINLTPQAYEDLENIWFYSQQHFGINKADEYINRISAIFDVLSQHEIGTHRDELGENIISIPIEKHVIFFISSPLEIVIIRVLNQAQDINIATFWK
ncbi:MULTISPECIES: type II toxin-antitoxin system RelE/ParE family toxin [Morganellaceae]|uniref:type II toxin-antitoxin system RelE/ParE family toxin n=1 Tax=Morganellaceae TaxID=1903414 RepID=UPI0018E4D87C|nr:MULTISPECIES: type II toxin-antitoxin system RelE/ParE family toxin [Morganellaceae]MBI6530051.1 type II toxin-antitoxin system RelE/ParE family toxin [Proteus vulgaris]